MPDETKTQEPVQNETSETPESQEPESTPTSQPGTIDRSTLDPTVAQYLNALDTQLRRAGRENAELRTKIDNIDTKLNAPPPLSDEDEKKGFYENPIAVIRAEVQNALKPLMQEASQIREANQRVSKVNDAIQELKSNPKFNSVWDANVEDTVTKILNGVPVDNINEEVAVAAGIQALGYRLLNGPVDTSKKESPVTNPNPAHVRPTNPTSPRVEDKPPTREPTEEERFIARMNGFKSFDDYLAFQSLPPDRVTTSKIGITETKS